MKDQNSKLTVEKIRQMGLFADKTDRELEDILDALEALSEVAFAIYLDGQRKSSGKLKVIGTGLDKNHKNAA